MAELVVLVRGEGTEADRRRTLDSLRRNTPDLDLGVFEGESAEAGPALDAALARGHRVLVVASPSADGPVADQLAWEVLQRTPAADVVLLEPGVTVGGHWRENLRRAAYADTVIATASAIPSDLLALPDASKGVELPHDDAVRGTALGEPLWGCVYVRRDALDIGRGARCQGDDPHSTSAPRLHELVLVPGLVHVLAAVVVEPAAARSLRDTTALTPGVQRTLAEFEAGIGPLRVTVDLRCCALPLTGTQVHALNLVTSLAARDVLHLSVLVPARVDESVRPHLDALPASVNRQAEAGSTGVRPHVFHRPYQVLNGDEIADVVSSGARLVVTHQDLILDRTPAYFPSKSEWRHYTATTAMTFVAADEVVFFSKHAQREAVRDALVDESKTSVVPPGTNHLGNSGDELTPAALAEAGAHRSPFVLVIGNAYIHKNRLFALRVVEELRRTHGWDGLAVFAGGNPADGSSAGDESRFLGGRPGLGATVVDLTHVTDAERRWLYRHAALVLYPTLYEGFGLIPFEAAAAGTPCVYSSRSSVAEYLPAEGALLDLRDVEETARRLEAVLGSAEAGDSIVRAIRVAGSELTWSRAADSYIDIYRRAMTRPVGLSLASGGDVMVGPTSHFVATETERRTLTIMRRNAAARRIVETGVAVVVRLRRVVQRFSDRAP